MMQHGIDVMEDVRRRDAVVRVENLKQRPRFGRDVFLLVLAVFGIGEQWEALCLINKIHANNAHDGQSMEWTKCTRARNTN